jgi:hypothetical protein
MTAGRPTFEPLINGLFKYRAFLSYRTTDARQARWLHAQLENYRVPRSLVGTHGKSGQVTRRIGRIFRDRDEARSSEQIESVIADELSRSQHLIVLCTPDAAASGSWVSREIELFRARRPDGAIHAVIGRGTPPECFPATLLTRAADRTIDAPLAADLRPSRDGGQDGARKAVVRIVAGLLGIEFDALWKREQRRRRLQIMVTIGELAAAALVAVGLLAVANFYRTHAAVNLDPTSLKALADDVEVVGTEETPENNGSSAIVSRRVSTRITLWVPASDVVLRLRARYRDGAERALALPLTLSPGFALGPKRLMFVLPSAEDIASHPGMAYIPATRWIHGRDDEARTSETPFWIDIRPPTVTEYSVIAQRLIEGEQLSAENSFVLTARQQHRAVARTGLDQLHSLNKDLGKIFGLIASATSTQVSAPADIVMGLVQLPCDQCPAPMTRLEASVYCASRNMRLPTALEWELSVRGVDGRVYPWGNRFDASRANVPGLPQKGSPPPSLKPVNAYQDQQSPFGLIDTVGNAGDWVTNDLTDYDHVYMGATYRFNPEDATAFRMLPVTDADYLVREITARCVAPVMANSTHPRVF